MTSANAYLGADLICRALETKAAVVITGRVGDPSLFLAPALHHFGWSYDDSDKLAVGSLAGHLLECSTQVTGGCFADHGRKEVTGLDDIGNPIADNDADGALVITKPTRTGGPVDPAAYPHPLPTTTHRPPDQLLPA